jgi:hypothetical protein
VLNIYISDNIVLIEKKIIINREKIFIIREKILINSDKNNFFREYKKILKNDIYN